MKVSLPAAPALIPPGQQERREAPPGCYRAALGASGFFMGAHVSHHGLIVGAYGVAFSTTGGTRSGTTHQADPRSREDARLVLEGRPCTAS